MEKEEKLTQYESLAEQLREAEQQIESMGNEREEREDELINKMGGVADHYQREKERNQRLISEMQRLNETLQKFETHIKQLDHDKSHLTLQTIALKDELSKL